MHVQFHEVHETADDQHLQLQCMLNCMRYMRLQTMKIDAVEVAIQERFDDVIVNKIMVKGGRPQGKRSTP